MASWRGPIISDGGTTGLLAPAAAADRGPGRSGEPGPVVWLAPIQAGVDAQVSRRAGERQGGGGRVSVGGGGAGGAGRFIGGGRDGGGVARRRAGDARGRDCGPTARRFRGGGYGGAD